MQQTPRTAPSRCFFSHTKTEIRLVLAAPVDTVPGYLSALRIELGITGHRLGQNSTLHGVKKTPVSVAMRNQKQRLEVVRGCTSFISAFSLL